MEKKIGKIRGISFGRGGYQDAMFGLNIDLCSDKDGWGVSDFKGYWMEDPDKYCEGSIADQNKTWADIVRFMRDLLSAAHKTKLQELKNVPVEVTFEDMQLKSWRILTEVL